jgi:DnaJ family protein C protein 8
LQAESELTDKDKREELDAAIRQARLLLLKELFLPISISDDDDRLRILQPSFKNRLRAKSKELLIEEEVARRKYVYSSFPMWEIDSCIS